MRIIIKGQPNSGKTTLAKTLRDAIPGSELIETDWIQVKLMVAGRLPKPKDYERKIGQVLHLLDENQKEILRTAIVQAVKLSEAKVIIIEGYALTLTGYELNEIDDDIVINKVSIHDDCFQGILDELKRRGLNIISRMIPRWYQRFDFTDGHSDSDSIGKFKALNLPSLVGKRSLDVGCNTGFFSFMAEKIGADESIGIDRDPNAIYICDILKTHVHLSHKTQFITMDVTKVPILGKFDLIMALSMLHYIENQDEVMVMLYEMLNPGGRLKLEMGLIHGFSDETVVLNGKYYPTFGKMMSMFPKSTISPSVNQPGDSVHRFVVTVKK